jgi:antitoxin ParD1/3/4
MASMNVSLPDPMRDWVQSRIESGQYASVSDYVRDLIRKDQVTTTDQQRWLASLDASVEAGLADAAAGRVSDGEAMLDRLRRKFAVPAGAHDKP